MRHPRAEDRMGGLVWQAISALLDKVRKQVLMGEIMEMS